MAFAVEPYIFDWIFFDDSSELKNLAVNLREERQQDVHARSISYYRLARYMRYISGVGVCVAYSCEWAAKALSSG